MKSAEIVIVGAGIAGASAAYFLARLGLPDIIILEKEETAGYHATGRSAAALARLSADEVFMRLSLMSTPFLRSPPEGFSQSPLLEPNGSLTVGAGTRFRLFRLYCRLAKRVGIASRPLSAFEARQRVPALEPALIDGGVFLPEDGLLDVHALLWGFLNGAQRLGAQVIFESEAQEIEVRNGSVHSVVSTRGRIRCRSLVNAAGAWANRVAALAGAPQLPLTPCRRHIVVARPAPGSQVGDWPMTYDLSRRFYFRPEPGGILASPMDQDPMEPCDARTDELRIAETADLLCRYTPSIAPSRIVRSWAGLRTLTVDRAPVVGEDPRVGGFFWLAGQGGHGIHTSPALGMIAAQLVARRTTELLDPRILSPRRFLRGARTYPTIASRRILHLARWLLDPDRVPRCGSW